MDNVCMEHSGNCEAINTLKKNEEDIFARLHALEIAVWKAAGATGVITGIVIILLEKWIKG